MISLENPLVPSGHLFDDETRSMAASKARLSQALGLAGMETKPQNYPK